jgi:hypothetical protein
MTHDQLAKVFPDGRTVHIPSDGHPLRGYALALADVERRGARPSEMSLEAAHESGIVTASIEQSAEKPKRSLLARLFGSRKNQDPDEVSEEPAPRASRAPVAVASVSQSKPKSVAVEQIVPLPTARPATTKVAVASVKPARQTFVTASLGSSLFDNRGYWHGAVQPGPDVAKGAASAAQPFETAGLETDTAGSTALAYASASDAQVPARTRPMGAKIPRLPKEATVMPAHGNTTVVAKPALMSALPADARSSDGLWLRAAMLAPSVSTYLTATRLGALDMRSLQELLHKPPMSVMMTFSGDPHLGMVSSHFSGPAVVFVATTTFNRQSTASLQ